MALREVFKLMPKAQQADALLELRENVLNATPFGRCTDHAQEEAEARVMQLAAGYVDELLKNLQEVSEAQS